MPAKSGRKAGGSKRSSRAISVPQLQNRCRQATVAEDMQMTGSRSRGEVDLSLGLTSGTAKKRRSEVRLQSVPEQERYQPNGPWGPLTWFDHINWIGAVLPFTSETSTMTSLISGAVFIGMSPISPPIFGTGAYQPS